MKIIIIGAEAAGASAAAKAKRAAPDTDITIYEKSQITSFGACGLPYFVGGHFDDENEMISRTAEQFAKGGINVRTSHEVISVNPVAKTVKIRNLLSDNVFEDSFDRLMIATGATSIVPPIENLNLTDVFTLKTLNDGLAIRQAARDPDKQNVIIIGAGFIGLELAEAMVEIGKSVRVIQLDERVLPDLFDRELTDLVENELKAAKVNLHVGESVKALCGSSHVTGVRTDKGSYEADLVIICTGVRPNTWPFRDIGIKMMANGAILTDECGQTSIPGIYAAGDCAALYHLSKKEPVYIPLATGANKLGRIIGDNLAGRRSRFPGTLGTAAIRVLNIEAGRTGITESEAVKLGIPHKAVVIRDKNHSNYIKGQTDIVAKLVYHKETRELLGGQVAGGTGSAMRANILATAIWNKMSVDELAMLDLLYAPPFSRPWDILNIAGGAAR